MNIKTLIILFLIATTFSATAIDLKEKTLFSSNNTNFLYKNNDFVCPKKQYGYHCKSQEIKPINNFINCQKYSYGYHCKEENINK